MPIPRLPMSLARQARCRTTAALLIPAALAGCGRHLPRADLGFLTRWTRNHYALARAERLSPPVASRLTAYAAVALYEGWAAFSDSLRSLGGQLNGLAPLPRPRRGERYDPALVALEAQTIVLRGLYKEGFASTQVAIAALLDSLLGARTAQGVGAAPPRCSSVGARMAVGVSARVRRRSLAYGKQLADAILAWAGRDGFATRSYAYAPRKGPQFWVPTASEAEYRSRMLSMDRDFVGLDNPTAAARPGEFGDRSLVVDRPKRAGNTSTPGINLTVALEPHWGGPRCFALRA